ncbi:MAG: PadR family transcriptional regulator [Phycisphaerales bacterium]|nr:PadR family transcriptional regulator [Phycisphaerales bacterium]
MRAERELMRGAGPVAVMKLLEAGPMYGYQLGEALARRSAGVLNMGQSTLYPMLYNLEAKGLIEAYWEDAPSEAGGRERKYYRLTEKGKTRLARDVAQWEGVAKAMAALGVIGGAGPAGRAAGVAGGGVA